MSVRDAQAIIAYMREHRKNLSYAMARIVTERYTHVSFATHGHTGETGEYENEVSHVIFHLVLISDV